MPTDAERALIYEALVIYLLNERQEETEVRTAFAALVQERHAQFHVIDESKKEEHPFTECSNQLCILALQILQTARKPRVELNDFGIEMIKNLQLKIQKAGRVCVAYLEDKNTLAVEPDGMNSNGTIIV